MVDSFHIFWFDEVTSTQDIAKELPSYSVVVANVQTRGRGRLGRLWEGGQGNLLATIVLPSVYETFALHTEFLKILKKIFLQWFNPERITVKSPNDILIDGKKISGILVECFKDKILLGVGINICTYPTNINQAATSLKDLDIFQTKEDVLKMILQTLSCKLNIGLK